MSSDQVKVDLVLESNSILCMTAKILYCSLTVFTHFYYNLLDQDHCLFIPHLLQWQKQRLCVILVKCLLIRFYPGIRYLIQAYCRQIPLDLTSNNFTLLWGPTYRLSGGSLCVLVTHV